ncbi:MFS transporter [Micromonospora wenchangensis]|uniref:MFS transporter n=1 Tax=Micromonospora wenchangensis TaxID=1185415 RepID=A0A246RNB7_9ACTN|nr:MFS transporter [Micromonospora wenchangensis]OWV08701.1 MFS transporter [Micromonospora wenchangensis]
MSQRRGTTLLILATAVPMFMVSLNNLVVTNALPVLARELDSGPDRLQWIIHAYSLSFAGLLLTGAAVGDRFGRRRIFTTGIVIFAVGSAVCALSGTLGLLVTGRVVQGIGAAIVFPLSLTLLANGVSDARRAMAIGLWSAVNGLGVALGPLIGGAVTESLGWEGIFWVSVPVGLVLVPVIRLILPESAGENRSIDLPGVLLASTAVMSLVWGIVEAGSQGWGSVDAVTRFGMAALLVALFVGWERRVAEPLLPLYFYRTRSFVLSNLVALLMFFGVFGALYWLMQYLQLVLGYSPLAAGVRTLPWTAMPMLVAVLAGLVTARVGAGRLMAAGLLLEAVALGWSAAIMDTAVPYGRIVPALLLGGIGMGLIFAPMTEAVLASVDRRDRGKASGANATVREVGFALGVAVLTTVVTRLAGPLTDARAFVDAVRPAVWLGAAVVALGAVAALSLPRRLPATDRPAPTTVESGAPS